MTCPILHVKSTVLLRIAIDFLLYFAAILFSHPKNHIIFQIYGFQCYVSVITKKDDLPFQEQYNKKRTVLNSEATKNKGVHIAVHTAPLVNANRDDDVHSCPGTAVHASGTSQLLPSPFVPA